ncbi:uncharacterized protein LOC110723521 [Chenopodium quinoa]|uniref:uncharacterized protein LOC110723521 n=1 Tax=Chenopodium quinoa TaxID=63459 RepID=UPI000B7865A5|nr:uncharacterized protein LOC110723521 [Chenopodium quinoa]
MATMRCLLALAASKGWVLYQLDINNAFLHGKLVEEVYMRMPKGIPNPNNLVCKLKRSLYGLKRASRQWFARLNEELHKQGFIQAKNDPSLFIYQTSTAFIIAAVYVDDIILTGTDLGVITTLKNHLHKVFSIKDLGELHYFLGIEVSHKKQSIILTQKKFSKELLQLTSDHGDHFHDPVLYKSLVGKLNFLTHTRPDLSYAVQTLSQFMSQQRIPHVQALHHVLRYIAGTIGQGILLQANSQLCLKAYSDSDWASCSESRKSVTGYVMLLGNSLVT